MFRVLIGVLLGFALSNSGYSWSGRGNGGDGVVCYEDAQHTVIKSVELLDYYIGNPLYHQPIEMGEASLVAVEKAKLAVKRIAKFRPDRATIYLQQIDDFVNEYAFVKELSDVDDSIHAMVYGVGLAANCKIEQLALQFRELDEAGVRYYIQAGFWERMDQNNRAGLILHEIFYRQALERGNENFADLIYPLTNYVSSSIFMEKVLTAELYDVIEYNAGMTAYAYSPQQPSGLGALTYIYEPGIKRTWREAETFCENNPDDGKLNNIVSLVTNVYAFGSSRRDPIFQLWEESPIGIKIKKDAAESGSAWLWVSSLRVSGNTHSLFNFVTHEIIAGGDANEAHEFICTRITP